MRNRLKPELHTGKRVRAGRVAEWSIAAVLKTAKAKHLRGFESLPFRHFWRAGPLQLETDFVLKNNLTLIITIVIVAAVFGYLWSAGHLVKIRLYWAEMVEELRKATWPTWAELKGSTVLVVVTMTLLGAFT